MTEPKTPAALADQAAESIRSLNHATLSGRPGWEYPSDAYDVVGDLARLVMMLPQAIEQCGKFFDALVEAGHVGVDGYGRERGTTVPTMQEQVAAGLVDAAAYARHLHACLTTAHSALSTATYTNGATHG
jgi:hypothetical protein